jgi:hypothetical protein
MRTPSEFHRAATVVALALASITALLLLVPDVNLGNPDEPAARASLFEEQRTILSLYGYGFVLFNVGLLVGAAGQLPYLLNRGGATVRVGMLFLLVGVVGHLVTTGVRLTVMEHAAQGDRTGTTQLIATLDTSPLLLPYFAAGLIGTVLGLALLGIGWWRAGIVRPWWTWTLLAALPLEFVLGSIHVTFTVLGRLLLVVAFGSLAITTLDRRVPAPTRARRTATKPRGRTARRRSA